MFKRLWWKRKRKKEKTSSQRPLQEAKLLYAYHSTKPKKPKDIQGYVYVFRLFATPNGSILATGVRRGLKLRRFVSEHLLTTSLPSDKQRLSEVQVLWAQIIPTPQRLPTHRIELGVTRKSNGSPRSPFFTEYFCFLSIEKDSDWIAGNIAKFLASQLEDTQVFTGEALDRSRAYWLAAILAAWKRLR